MKGVAMAMAMLWLQAGYDGNNFDRGKEVDAAPERFQFQRVLQTAAGAQGQACAVLDGAVYAHTNGELSALRIYSAGHEVPFALTESGEAGQQEEPARVMNLGRQGAAIVFDLAMPQRTYTEVVLDLAGKDFYATAKVSGMAAAGAARTELGQFVLFDLRSQGLSRSTTLPLQEASFPLLHVEMMVTAAPGTATKDLGVEMVRGAAVPPSREAQMLYTTVAETETIAQKGRESVASLLVPAHVPVERVRFAVRPEFAKNFSREVRVSAHSSQTEDSVDAEIASGEIQRVRLPVDAFGREIRSEQMSVEAVVGANLRSDATVTVAVENGDDVPLPLRSVELQMRQRKVCFDAEPGAAYVMRYGASGGEAVRSPVYDYARLFAASAAAGLVTVGAEMPNPEFRVETRHESYTERHPEVLWVALLLVIAVLGSVALHNARRVGGRK